MSDYQIMPRETHYCNACGAIDAPFGRNIQTDGGKKLLFECGGCLDQTVYPPGWNGQVASYSTDKKRVD